MTTETLGDARGTCFSFAVDSDYMRAHRQYADSLPTCSTRSRYGPTLRSRDLRLEVLIDQHRRAEAEGDAQFTPAALEALQLDLKNVYVDEGWGYTLREQATAQDGLDGRDSYGQALTAQKAAGQECAVVRRVHQAQRAARHLRHAIRAERVRRDVDGIRRQRGHAREPDGVRGVGRHDVGGHRQADQEVQKKAQERLAALVALRRDRGLAETRAMGEWLAGDGAAPADAAKLQALDDNRQFHEATAGGLMRMAACFENAYDALLDKGYRIALKHGQLAFAEMRQAVNLKEGRAAGGNDPLFKRIIDPVLGPQERLHALSRQLRHDGGLPRRARRAAPGDGRVPAPAPQDALGFRLS